MLQLGKRLTVFSLLSLYPLLHISQIPYIFMQILVEMYKPYAVYVLLKLLNPVSVFSFFFSVSMFITAPDSDSHTHFS